MLSATLINLCRALTGADAAAETNRLVRQLLQENREMSQSLNTKAETLTTEVTALRTALADHEQRRDAADAKLADTIAAQTAELERLRALPVDTSAAEASIQAAIDGIEAARQTLVAPTPAPAKPPADPNAPQGVEIAPTPVPPG